MRVHRMRRHGSAYLILLGTATILTILGLSGLLAVRVELRGSRVGESATKARFAAASIMETALLRVGGDELWRKNYTHDTWTADETIGDARCCYKLVCQYDNKLDSNAIHPTRLYAKAQVGDAVRIYSVLIDDSGVESTNLVNNGNMESGTANWDTVGWYDKAYLKLNEEGSSPHAGLLCLQAKERKAPSAGPMQNVTAQIESGKEYTAIAWVRMKDTTDVAIMSLYIETTTGWKTILNASKNVDTTWREATAMFTPSWSGTLKRAFLAIRTANTTKDFYVDDVVMTERDNDTPMVIRTRPGTWRREPGL